VKKLLLMAAASLIACVQVVRPNDKGDFPLTLHITAIEMEQGNTGVSGSGYTDSNGNYHSSVDGGSTPKVPHQFVRSVAFCADSTHKKKGLPLPRKPHSPSVMLHFDSIQTHQSPGSLFGCLAVCDANVFHSGINAAMTERLLDKGQVHVASN